MIPINILTKSEVEDMIKAREAVMRQDFYQELNKLREQNIALNDIIKVLKRG